MLRKSNPTLVIASPASEPLAAQLATCLKKVGKEFSPLTIVILDPKKSDAVRPDGAVITATAAVDFKLCQLDIEGQGLKFKYLLTLVEDYELFEKAQDSQLPCVVSLGRFLHSPATLSNALDSIAALPTGPEVIQSLRELQVKHSKHPKEPASEMGWWLLGTVALLVVVSCVSTVISRRTR